MTEFSRRIDVTLDTSSARVLQFVLWLLRRVRVVWFDTRLVVSASWVRASRSTVLRYAQRYGYRTRHHRHAFSSHEQVDASVLAVELYYERMKRIRVGKINPIPPLRTAEFKTQWRKSWRESQEVAFMHFTDIVEAQAC